MRVGRSEIKSVGPVELADRDTLFQAFRHPYTRGADLDGADPGPEARAGGGSCSAVSCPRRSTRRPAACSAEICAREVPAIGRIGEDHQIACHRWREV